MSDSVPIRRASRRGAGRWLALGVAVLAVGVAVLGVGGLAAPALADSTVTVTTTSDETTAGDGTCSLREAIAYANGDNGNGTNSDCGVAPSGTTTIKVPASHYVLTSALSIGSPSAPPGPVVIDGGGTGPLGTTIDGGGNDTVLNVFHGANATINSLTVTGGHTDTDGPGNFPGDPGGGISNGGTLKLVRVVVTGNRAADGANGPPGDGSAGGDGGGIDNSGALTLIASTVSNNAAGNGGNGDTPPFCFDSGSAGGAGGAGGGVATTAGTVTVVNSTITGNASGSGGNGGAGQAGASCGTFAKGTSGGAGGPGGAGAGIANDGGTVTVRASTIDDNHAGTGGTGGAAGTGSGGAPNGANGAGGAGGDGGGIFNGNLQVLTLINSTVALNTAGNGGLAGSCSTCAAGAAGAGGNGGGILQDGSSATVQEATIARNLAGQPGAASPNGHRGAGSGIDVLAGELTEIATIVSQDDCSGPVGDGGHNLLFAGFGCPGLVGNPLLGPLQNNGGPTRTMALAPGSAAIDKVPTSGAGCSTTDQRGQTRPDVVGTQCDIGAYEALTGPKFFALHVNRREAQGATITVELRKPRELALQIYRHTSHHRLVLVGLVRLGHHPAGRSRIHWNLRVHGRLLPQGGYQVTLYALDNGFLSQPSEPGPLTLVVLKHGHARAGA